MVYVGQTGRNFKEKITEHSRNYFNQEDTSNYADKLRHFIENTHKFNIEYKVLHQAQKGVKLNFLEALEIYRLRDANFLLNDQSDLNSLPLLNILSISKIVYYCTLLMFVISTQYNSQYNVYRYIWTNIVKIHNKFYLLINQFVFNIRQRYSDTETIVMLF